MGSFWLGWGDGLVPYKQEDQSLDRYSGLPVTPASESRQGIPETGYLARLAVQASYWFH